MAPPDCTLPAPNRFGGGVRTTRDVTEVCRLPGQRGGWLLLANAIKYCSASLIGILLQKNVSVQLVISFYILYVRNV